MVVEFQEQGTTCDRGVREIGFSKVVWEELAFE
jgi:hypothetical protein